MVGLLAALVLLLFEPRALLILLGLAVIGGLVVWGLSTATDVESGGEDGHKLIQPSGESLPIAAEAQDQDERDSVARDLIKGDMYVILWLVFVFVGSSVGWSAVASSAGVFWLGVLVSVGGSIAGVTHVRRRGGPAVGMAFLVVFALLAGFVFGVLGS